MRLGIPFSAALIVCSLLAGCSGKTGNSRTDRTSVTASNSSDVVDGITIPPPYVAPVGTVVPGPSSCPIAFAATLSAAAAGRGYSSTSEVTSHLISCSYRALRASIGDCTRAAISVNTEPQAFKAFNRWNVETGQNSMWTNKPNLRPTPVAGIGIEAEWVPGLLELGAGNDTTWVSVKLTCPANTPRVLVLAKRLALTGLDSTA